ncbi:ubiquitin carboxyl-terminal hydrolase 42-like [Falco naumanni]|uniref:ubiquitin carboxyl-terminal hydrolase 42-like n=1 Tax=Falco naumanni TaxID=148594 RepID=UPI001ADEBA16|nr:ubiquitin carboxyl-terminal hydrolase 42-like [Falco naumanni]
MAPPQRIHLPPEKIHMEWQQRQRPGAGLYNPGTTCFVNAVLQCLTYTPPLASYLLSREHSSSCHQQGFCMMCIMEAHVNDVLHTSASAIMPTAIINALPLTCCSCNAVFDSCVSFLHIPLHIKAASSVTAALENFVKPEQLGGENSFRCSKCVKTVTLLKRVTIDCAPRVLTLRLGRSDAVSEKNNKFFSYPLYLDLGPYMSQAAGEPLHYALYAVLVHSGESCHEGHFFCYIKASNALWYQTDDTSVTCCGLYTVLKQEAYLLLYVRCSDLKTGQQTSSSSVLPYARSFHSQWEASSQLAGPVGPQDQPCWTKEESTGAFRISQQDMAMGMEDSPENSSSSTRASTSQLTWADYDHSAGKRKRKTSPCRDQG